MLWIFTPSSVFHPPVFFWNDGILSCTFFSGFLPPLPWSVLNKEKCLSSTKFSPCSTSLRAQWQLKILLQVETLLWFPGEPALLIHFFLATACNIPFGSACSRRNMVKWTECQQQLNLWWSLSKYPHSVILVCLFFSGSICSQLLTKFFDSSEPELWK